MSLVARRLLFVLSVVVVAAVFGAVSASASVAGYKYDDTPRPVHGGRDHVVNLVPGAVEDDAGEAHRVWALDDVRSSLTSSGVFCAPRGVLPTPQVTNTKLQNIVNDLYKGTTSPARVGTGTTADALRHELATGLPTSGRFHLQKAEQYSIALRSVLKHDLGFHDRLVARSLLDDLQRARMGQP